MNAARPARTGTVCRWTTTRISTAWPSEARLRMPWTVSLERAGGLDDEVVQARFGRVQRDAGHDVGKADGRVAAGELRVGEAAAVGQQVHRESGRDLLAVLKEADERVRVQRRLAAGQAEGPRAVRQQADHLPCPVEQPGVVAVFRRLGAHEAVVVALLGEQQAVVPGGVLPQHGDPAAVGGDVDDVASVEMRQFGPEPEHRAGRPETPDAIDPATPSLVPAPGPAIR